MEKKKKKENKSQGTSVLIIMIIVLLILIGVLFIRKKVIQSNSEEQEKLSSEQSNAIDNEEDDDSVITAVEEEDKEFVSKQDDGSQLNTSNKLKEERKLDGLEISNITLRENGGITTLLADVKNTTGAATPQKNVKVTLLDKEGNNIIDLSGIIDAMESGETVKLNVSVTSDLSNAYDFTISNE